MDAVWPGTGSSLDETTAANVDLNAVLENDMVRDVICFLNAGGNEYEGDEHLGVRVSALFVVLIVSSAVTFFPVIATRSKRMRIPLYVYLFARYFGAGVIIATAFIHLLDPAYEEIGPASCVGMTGGWSQYSFVAGIALSSGMFVFLLDFAAERYVEKKYDMTHGHGENFISERRGSVDDAALAQYNNMSRRISTHQHLHSGDQDRQTHSHSQTPDNAKSLENGDGSNIESLSLDEKMSDALAEQAFRKQISAFLILEFGVLFHSVIIGLTLSTAAYDEFTILYPVIVFHQSFEGLGLGARLSAIPFPKRLSWMPWALCAGYGLTTPLAIAIGLGVRTTYNPGSFTANVVSGVLDATSAGILLYSGFVEFLARDFLFNPDRTKDDRQLAFMVFSVVLGAALMALLGKWA